MIDKVKFSRTNGRGSVDVPEEYDILKWFLESDVDCHPYSCRGLLLSIDAILDGRKPYDDWGGNLCMAFISPGKTVIRYGMGQSAIDDPDLMKMSTEDFRDVIAKCLEFGIQQGWDITDEQIRYQIEEFNHSLEKRKKL